MADDLDSLIADGVIDEVLGRIKSGKEATISMVRRGDAILAAKVYKDRATRSFKNNAEYKEGRKVRNTRTQRAMDSGGKFGRDSAEQAWKSAEADALYRLAGTGVRTPAPVMFYEGVLLMELVLDANGSPAPRLEEITLERDAVLGVYADLVAQLIAMLCCDLVHGDLSPYNILLAADGPTIIDFPQVISAAHNTRAEHFFMRDFENVHSHLAAMDPSLAPHRVDGRAIWQAYVRRDLTPEFVPPPPPPIQPRRTERVFEPRRGNDRRPGGPPPRGNRPLPPGALLPPIVTTKVPVVVAPTEPPPNEWKESDWAPSPPRPPAPPPKPEPRADQRASVPRFDNRGPNQRNEQRGPNPPRGNEQRSHDSRPGNGGWNPPRANDARPAPAGNTRSWGARDAASSSRGSQPPAPSDRQPAQRQPQAASFERRPPREPRPPERAPLKPGESPFARRREEERSEYRARDPNQPASPSTPTAAKPAAAPPSGDSRRRRRRFS